MSIFKVIQACKGFLDSSVGEESTCNAGDPSSIHGSGRFPGEWKDYPLHYPGLENSMDCTVNEVTKFQTQLSDFHTSFIWIQMLVYHNGCFFKKIYFYSFLAVLCGLCSGYREWGSSLGAARGSRARSLQQLGHVGSVALEHGLSCCPA